MRTNILKNFHLELRNRHIPRVIITIIVMIRQDQRALKKSNTATFEFSIQKHIGTLRARLVMQKQTNGYGAQMSSREIGSLQH